MIMIDVGFPIRLIDNAWCFFNNTSAFVQHLKMPQMRPTNGVATYLANHYPKTSNALFDGKSKEACLQVFMVEKGSKWLPKKQAGSAGEAREELKKTRSYLTIKMRSLSKNHDWKTVK
jgi:hypothetical protein